MFSMRPEAVPAADDRFDVYPGFGKKTDRVEKNAATPVSITAFDDPSCGLVYDSGFKFGPGNSTSTSR